MSIPNPHFEASYDRLFGEPENNQQSDLFFKAFYERFTKHGDVAAMFAHTDEKHQIHMLKRSVYDLVNLSATQIIPAELMRIIDRHKVINASLDHLDIWLTALLDTVDEFDTESNELVRLAWTCAITPGITLFRLSLNNELA